MIVAMGKAAIQALNYRMSNFFVKSNPTITIAGVSDISTARGLLYKYFKEHHIELKLEHVK